jgi:hypothetical protein
VSNFKDRSGDVKLARFYVLRFCFGGGRDIFFCLMSDARRFPPPWTVEELDACYVVRDARSLHAKVKITMTILWSAFYCQ